MSCTTILVGKKASYDGSTIIARDDDSGSGRYDPKKFIAVAPQDQPRHYRSVLSHVEIDLPDNPCRYSIVPNVLPNRGILAEAGVSEHNVAMSATETIAVNERVLAADPLVELQPANEAANTPEVPGGIGEEDIITLVLPYVTTAREGVARLAELLETYGTYESNGIIISDVNEIWYVETIGGHHWIARRVPDDCYATIPNQLGIDDFDFDDAFSTQREFMCSADLREFMDVHHLDRTMSAAASSGFGFQSTSAFGNGGMNGGGNSSSDAALGHNHFNPRTAFGTATTKDHIYNTPRAWYMQRYLNPSEDWDSPTARYTPASDDIPWCRVPENAVTLEDVDFLMSAHFEGTPYDPYGTLGTSESRHRAYGGHADPPVRAGNQPFDHVDFVRFRPLYRGHAVLCERQRYARLPARHHVGSLDQQPVLGEPFDRRARRRAFLRNQQCDRRICGIGPLLRPSSGGTY